MEIDDNKIHDFRNSKLRWGWSILDFRLTDDTPRNQKAEISAIGKNINDGEYVLMNNGINTVLWEIGNIKYSSNPTDLFHADLSFMGVPDD